MNEPIGTRIIVEYSGQYLIKYHKERAQRIVDGWKVLDVNLSQTDQYLGGRHIGSFVTGNIVYEKQ